MAHINSSPSLNDDRPLRLGGVPEHFNLPWHLAMEHNLADLALSWEDQFGGTGEMVEKLRASELDVVSILTEGTVAAIDDGLDVTILQTYVESPLQWGIFAPAGHDSQPGPHSRIAISRFGSGSHLMAYVLADAQGWSVDQNQFVPVGSLSGAVDAFASGSADLFLWDQYMTRPLVDDGLFEQLGTQRTPWPSFVIAVRNPVLTGRTFEVGRIVDAVVDQAGRLHQRPEIVAELCARYDLPDDAARGWLASTSYAKRGPYDPATSETIRLMLSQVKGDR